MQNYYGDPYVNCKPECIQNSDCPINKACLNMKCINPCASACGLNSECYVVNHLPQCTCLPDYTGNPIKICRQIIQSKKILNLNLYKYDLPSFILTTQ